MKVIDLLNKIANKEDIPIKIKINGNLYRQANGQFWCDETEMYMIDNCTSIYNLNDEVEIIEENKKIEKLFAGVRFDDDGNRINEVYSLNKLANKINEIIDKINEMREDKE